MKRLFIAAILLVSAQAQQISGPGGGSSSSAAGVVYCAPASASSTAYTCPSASPAITSYTTGVTLAFVPDVNSGGGATTVAVDGLTGKSIKLGDGSTNPSSTTFVANVTYYLTYDGTVFRISTLASPAGGLKSCIVTFSPASGAVLADTDDAPYSCGNLTGSDQVISGISCLANAGSLTMTPIFTGGGTIVSGVISCGNGTWVAGTLSGTPTLHSFSANAATCSSTPCTIDANITTAGGSATYAVLQIVY